MKREWFILGWGLVCVIMGLKEETDSEVSFGIGLLVAFIIVISRQVKFIKEAADETNK